MNSPQLRPSLRASLLVLAAASLFGAAPAPGQTVSPVPAPTIITSVPYTISSAGYYQLGANLNVTGTSGNIITVNASNVTLDFAGHYITGPDPTPTSTTLNGVYAYERANLLIQNGTVSHCRVGVYLDGNNQSATNNVNAIVRNLLANDCSYCGVELTGPVNATVTQNRVTNTGGGPSSGYVAAFGIYVAGGGAGNTVSNNTIANLTAASGHNAIGIAGALNYAATGNSISNVTSSTGTAAGMDQATFAVGNLISHAIYGLSFCTKYKDNLTDGCTYPFNSGTDAGGNN